MMPSGYELHELATILLDNRSAAELAAMTPAVAADLLRQRTAVTFPMRTVVAVLALVRGPQPSKLPLDPDEFAEEPANALDGSDDEVNASVEITAKVIEAIRWSPSRVLSTKEAASGRRSVDEVRAAGTAEAEIAKCAARREGPDDGDPAARQGRSNTEPAVRDVWRERRRRTRPALAVPWSNVVNDCVHNDKIRRDALIALSLVLVAVIVIVFGITGVTGPLIRDAANNEVVRIVAGSMLGGSGFIYGGLRFLRGRRARPGHGARVAPPHDQDDQDGE